MSTLHIVPAYGRDYKSKTAVESDFRGNKDFQIRDISSTDDGRYVNLADLKSDGQISQVQIRYDKLRKVTILEV